MLSSNNYNDSSANSFIISHILKEDSNKMSTINQSAILESNNFPDIIQHFTHEQCKIIIDLLKIDKNKEFVNKRGPLGGYTILHWLCIKNEHDLIETLIIDTKPDVNLQANAGESPLFICIK
jgi:hypothetical protein